MSDPAASTVTIEELLAQGRWLRRLAVSLVHDEEAAEELAQAGLVQALTHPPRHGGNLRAWFAVVLRNLARHQGATARREREERTTAAELREQAQESGEQIVMRIETQQLVGEALLQLDPRHRDVLVLRYYDELSYREIAERLDLPQATVRSRTERGLQELRKQLDLLGGEHAVDWRLGVTAWVGAAARPRGGAASVSGGASGAWTGVAVVATLCALGAALAVWKPWRGDPAVDPALAPPNAHARAATSRAVAGGSGDESSRAVVAHDDLETANDSAPIELELTGRVLRADTGEPVSGADVRWSTGGLSGRYAWGTAVTDAEGYYTLRGAPTPGPASTADTPSFESVEFVLRVEVDAGLAPFEDMMSALDYRSPSEADGLALRGTLPTVRLAPAADVEVRLSGDWGERGGLWLFDQDHGHRGDHRMRQVGAWFGGDEISMWEAFGARVDDTSPLLLVASDGARLAAVELDLRLVDDGPSVLELVAPPVAPVEVVVRDTQGRPVVGERVRATALFPPLRDPGCVDYCSHRLHDRPTGLQGLLNVETDADGVARFTGLPIGGADARAGDSAGAHAFGTYAFCVGSLSGEAKTHRASPPIAPGPDGARVELTYDPEARVALEVTVVDERGAPVPGVDVVVEDRRYSAPDRPGQGARTVTERVTDTAGVARFDDVDRAGQGLELVTVRGERVARATVSFPVRVPEHGMRRVTLELPRAVTLQVRLVDANGAPLGAVARGLRVQAVPFGPDADQPLLGKVLELKNAGGGLHEMEGVPAGRVLLTPKNFDALGVHPFAPRIVEAGRDEVEIRVERFDPRMTQLSVALEPAREGGAVALRRAVAVLPASARGAATVVHGAIDRESATARWDLPPGRWWILLRADGGRAVWREVVLDGAAPTIALSETLGVSGSLSGSLGEGATTAELADAVVVVRGVGPGRVELGLDAERELGALERRVEIGTAGSFRLDDLPPGDYEVRLLGGAAVARSVVTVRAGEETRAMLEPHSARRLSLIGETDRHRGRGLRLLLVLRDADGSAYAWPIDVTETGATALLPPGAVDYEVAWWSPPGALLIAASPFGEASTGSLGRGETRAPLPR